MRILEKNIGFFDLRENNASVLTSAMAEDTGIINGASTESLSPYSDAAFAILAGISIGLYLSPYMALICLGLTPFMAVGQYIAA